MSEGLGVVVVGDSKVGKTCLIQTYGVGEYPETYESTASQSYKTNLRINRESIEVNIHDTGGSSQFKNLRLRVYGKSDVFLICFDLTERMTFQHVDQFWLNEIRKMRGTDVPFVIVGCKSDLRVNGNMYHVQRAEGVRLATELGCHYYECSAVTQRNIKETFDKAVKIAMELEPRSMSKDRGCFKMLCLCKS